MKKKTSIKVSFAFLALVVAILAIFITNLNYSIQSYNIQHYGEVHGCHTDIPISKRNISKCTIQGATQRDPIYLIGDSNADQFSEAVIKVSEKIHHSLKIATISGCPFLPGYVNAPKPYAWSKTKPTNCANYYKDAMVFLSKSPSGVVIIAFSDQYFREHGWRLGISKTKSSVTEAKRVEWLRIGLNDTFKEIKGYGHKILFVYTIPQLNYRVTGNSSTLNPYSPSLCSIISIILMNCDRSLSLESYMKVQYSIKTAENKVVKNQGVNSLDLFTDICNRDLCTNRKFMFWIYRDGSHISVGESQKLESVFLAKLLSMLG